MTGKCPFCEGEVEEERIIYKDERIYVLFDLFPVNKGHILVMPTRHVKSFLDLTENEILCLYRAVKTVIKALKDYYNPAGFNVGFNQGEQAGQTIEHFHIHVIPRYMNDCNSPRGGIRKVILDIPTDEEHPLRERFIRSRPTKKEYDELRRIFNNLWTKERLMLGKKNEDNSYSF